MRSLRGLWFPICVSALVLTACQPEPQSPDVSVRDVAEKCYEAGGMMVEADGMKPDCSMPESEAERERNRASHKFWRACEALEGFDLGGDHEVAACVSFDEVTDLNTNCRKTADCEGTCVTVLGRDDVGICVPKRPLLGCFVEFGAAKRNVICAE